MDCSQPQISFRKALARVEYLLLVFYTNPFHRLVIPQSHASLCQTLTHALGFEVPKAALPFGWTDTDGFFLEWDTHEVWNDDKQEYEPQVYVRWKTPRNLYATTNFKDLMPKKTRKELN